MLHHPAIQEMYRTHWSAGTHSCKPVLKCALGRTVLRMYSVFYRFEVTSLYSREFMDIVEMYKCISKLP